MLCPIYVIRFHVSLDTQLPSSETITLADNLLIYSYGILGLALIWTVGGVGIAV